MPDWRRNVLSSSETFIDALSVAARAQKIEQERLLEVTQTKNNVSSFPRRNCNKYNQQMICPYTTVFLGSPDVNGQNGVDSKFLTDATMDIKHVDVYSLDRSSNVTHTSSFAHYQNRSLTPDYEISNPKEFRLCQSDYCLDGRVTLQIQKVPYTTSVFYVSARNEFSEDETIPSSELYLIDTASDISDGHVISDAISTCTCDSFERTSFDCKDFEPFSDTCCCEPCDGVCSRSPKDLESPDHLLGLGDTCRKGTKLHGEDGVSLSNRSDMEGLDLTIFEPAENNCVEMGSYEMMGGVGNVAAYRIEMENSACNEDVNSHMFLVSQEETSANGESLGPAGDTLSGLLHVAVDVNDNPRSPIKGAAGPPSLWEPHYCVLQQERRTLTAYTSEELASFPGFYLDWKHRNSTGAGKRVRLDGGGLRCWAAPPSIAEEDVDERDDDFTSLNAYVTTPTDTSYEKACRRGSAPSSPAPGAPPPGHSPSRLAAFFFSKRSFRGGNPLKRTKSATKLERERAMLAAAGQPGAAHSALHALRTSRSHESLLSAHSPAVSTMDLGPPHEVEIRALHASVLGRPHCFALSAEGRAPRYFACASRRECDRWIYSLKQAARPGEMRGRRTERSLRLWVQEAKALPPKKRYYCEITLDDTLYARTSSKLKTEMCFWGEVFEFASLPAVRNVCINVYREPDRKPRKHTKHTLVGTVKIPVDDVSSRYLSERWYPVVPEGSEKSSPGSGSGQTPAERTPPPSLRVKCRYQVTDVLPIDAYAGFLDYLKRNYKKVCEYLEPVIGVKAKEDIGCALVLAMQGVGRAPRFLADVVALDVRRTGDHSLTFRGNSLATKSMEAYLKVVGDQYLQETLGEAVSLAAAAGAECEVDPARGGGGGGGGALRRRQAALRQAVEVTWARVADSAQRFPPDLRECFATFRERLTAMGREDISDNLISASIFLRFLCPAILSPSLFGITHEFPSERAARNLTLIAKTLQTLANFTRFQGKEAFMEFLNDFLEKEAPRMKTFLREISTRAPSSQRNSDPSASSVSEEQAGQSWAPHADMGRQLAVLHGLLADCLTKLPPGRVQELDPLPEILEELSRRQSCPDGGALPSAELADNIFRFNDPTCNNKVGESLPTPNFAHSSPLPAQNPNENKYADKNTYATISKSPSFNTRAATLPRNGYPPSVNPDRYSSQYNNQEHCVNLKVIQIGLDATPYAKTPLIKQVNGRNSNLDSNTPQIVTNDKRNECFNNKMNNFNQQNFYNNHNRTYGTVNDNYYPDNVQSLRKETANLDELSDLLKYADDQDIDVVEEKLNVRKNNLTQSHSNNNVTGGLKSHNYGNTNGSNMSISGNSNVASSGYQSFATYSQSSSPIEPQTNHVAYDNNNGQPLSRYSQMNNYNKQRERFYDGKSERIYPTKNATQQKIEYDLQKYGIQNFTTDDGSQPIKNGSTTNLAPLVFTNPVYSMENGVMTNRPMEKDCIRNAKKYGDVTKKPNKRCGCGSSSSSMDEEGMTTDNPETNSEEGAPNFANSETRHENGSYDRLNNLQNKTLSYDRNSNRTSSSAESNYSHRKLTRDIYGYEPDYITKQGVEINNEEADYKRNYKQDNDSPNNSPSIRKVGKTRMPRTNPSLSYSNNQNQLNLKHFGQRGDAIYETINNNGNNDNYTTNNRSESNVEEVNKEMYRLQISRSQQAIYNGTDNRQALMNALHNSPRSDKNYNLERNYSAVNVPNETNYILERNYSASNVSSTRLNDELNSQEGSRYGKCCNELRQSPSSAKVRLGLGLDLGTGEKVKEKLQRRLSLESARELTDSSSDMEDIHYSTTGRRRTKGNHRTIEQYEREIERLQCSVELLRQKLEGAGDASDHDHSSDTKMKAIISRLICVEEELRREQRKMSLALSHKQRVIEAQEHRIAALDAANTRLLSALTNLQQRAPPAPPAPSAAHGVPPTPPHEVQI